MNGISYIYSTDFNQLYGIRFWLLALFIAVYKARNAFKHR